MITKKILILGAFDRFNYGDLLFPIIIELSLKREINNCEFYYYGLKKSDMSLIGAKKTSSISEFYKQCNFSNEQVWVIIAGGEVLPITWAMMFSHLNPFYHLLSGFKRLMNIEPFIKQFFAAKTDLPFLISKNSFHRVKGVIYNSIGASGANESAFEKYKSLTDVQYSDYFSVRDSISFENFKNVANPQLYPDSAILLSRYFELDSIEDKLTKEVKNFVEKIGKRKYIYFQINKETYLFNKEPIKELLKNIYAKYEIHICLCPIGLASGHSDQVALKSLHYELNLPSSLFTQVNIWDIIYLIGNSKCYLGTSLHGVITSMSYCVPYLGFSVGKISNYLKSWGNADVNYCSDIEDILGQFEIVINSRRTELENNRNFQIQLAIESFNNMVEIINK